MKHELKNWNVQWQFMKTSCEPNQNKINRISPLWKNLITTEKKKIGVFKPIVYSSTTQNEKHTLARLVWTSLRQLAFM